MLVWLLPLSGHSPPYVGRARTPPATHLQQNMAEDGVVQKVYLEPGSRYAQDQGHRFDGASTSMPPMLTPGGTHGMASDHSYVERPRALDTEPYRTMTRTRVRDRFTQSIDPWDRETSGENVIALLEPLARSKIVLSTCTKLIRVGHASLRWAHLWCDPVRVAALSVRRSSWLITLMLRRSVHADVVRGCGVVGVSV